MSKLPFAGSAPAPMSADGAPEGLGSFGARGEPSFAGIGSALAEPAPATLAALAHAGAGEFWTARYAPPAPALSDAPRTDAESLSEPPATADLEDPARRLPTPRPPIL
jgi:hypothetical protein